MKKFLKIINIAITFSFLFSQVVWASYPISISMGDVKDSMGEAESRYGFDENSYRKGMSQAGYPTAEVYFSNTEPKEGDEVTASAYGLRFKNTDKDLYYTWYLVRKEDQEYYKDNEGSLPKDYIIETAKTRAMGIVARGNYDPILFEETYDDPNKDPDEDSFKAPFGGIDGAGGKKEDNDIEGIGTYEQDEENLLYPKKGVVDGKRITHCYRHNFGTEFSDGKELGIGKDLIVECRHKFALTPEYEDDPETQLRDEEDVVYYYKDENDEDQPVECDSDFVVGDGEFDTEEEACWQLNPNSSDTDGDGVPDEADLAGLGQSSFTWKYKEGDRVGVIIEGTSLVPINAKENGVKKEKEVAKEIFDEMIKEEEGKILGGGYINKQELVSGIVDYFHKNLVGNLYLNNPVAIGKIIDNAGVSKYGGIIEENELADLMEDNRDIADFIENENNYPRGFDATSSDYIFIEGVIDLDAISDTLNNFFIFSCPEADMLIEDLSDPVKLAIREKFGTTGGSYLNCNNCTWEYFRLQTLLWAYYDSNGRYEQNLTPELINTFFIGNPNEVDVIYPPGSGIVYTVNSSLPLSQFEKYFYISSGDDAVNADNGSDVYLSDQIESILATSGSANDEIQEEIDLGLISYEGMSYNKIMWAGIDICSSEVDGEGDDIGFLNDECEDSPEDVDDYRVKDGEEYKDYDKTKIKKNNNEENNTEYGFHYLATVPVFQENKKSVTTTLKHFPEDPIYDRDAPDFSDKITVFSSLVDQEFDSDFVYYDWEIYKCKKVGLVYDLETCSETGYNLTMNCQEGDSLENCASICLKAGGSCNEDEYVRNIFSSTSFTEGMGMKTLNFSPSFSYDDGLEKYTSTLIDENEDEVWLKVYLKTTAEELESRKIKHLTSDIIKISNNDTKIKFYKTRKDENSGVYTYYDEGGISMEICDQGIDKFICPVYPFQILAAKADINEIKGEEIKGYFWEVDGKRVNAIQNCEGDACGQDIGNDGEALVYLPISKTFDDMQEVTLNLQIKNEDGLIKNIKSTRYLSVRNPLALIKANNESAWTKKMSEDYVNVFYTNPGNRVEFLADIIPGYLDLEEDNVNLTWSIGGEVIDDAFMAIHPEMDFAFYGDKISFVTPSDLREMALSVRVSKFISEETKNDLYGAWKITSFKDKLQETATINLRRDFNNQIITGGEEVSSLKMFFASTVKNTPEYLIFSLKLSIVIVLVWSALFGSSFFFETYNRKRD